MNIVVAIVDAILKMAAPRSGASTYNVHPIFWCTNITLLGYGNFSCHEWNSYGNLHKARTNWPLAM